MFDLKRARQHAVLLPAVCFAAMTAAYAQNPAVTISVDAGANHRAINPNIYGVNFAAASDLTALNSPLNRSGGNAETRYNWQLNSDNRANDFYYESIADTSATPGERRDTFFSNTKATGAQTMETIPMIPYIGTIGSNRSLNLWSFSIAKYGAQTGADFGRPDAGNGISAASGNPFITGNNPLDANVANSAGFQLGWVQHMKATWGAASAGGLKYYLMDNESGLWQETHRDVKPIGAKMDEIYNDIIAYAADVKNTDSTALVVAPEEWGWAGYLNSPFDKQCNCTTDRAAHGGMDYMPWLLQSLKSYDTAHGTRSIDVFSLHWYPQNGEYSTDDSLNEQLIRNKSTRSLWDPNYTDISWINTQVQLIPRMKNWVATYYPGLQTAINEYNWGDEANLNGATTQADIYGIFGREGLDMACRWTVPAANTPTYLAMAMYRNYDGAKSTFGDTSVFCGAPNPDQLSAFAATRASDGALTVMVINKIAGTTPVTINLANYSYSGTAHAYQISTNTQTSITHLADVTVANDALSFTAPSQSITLFVIVSGTTQTPPSTPTGLTATANNTQVTLNWSGGAGATSYNVQRSTTSGGPYTTVGTVLSPSLPTFTNTGLTNGTTYYYVVNATNSHGTSGNSNQASGTPNLAAPTNLTGTVGISQVLLNWTAPLGATSYHVLRSTVNGSGYSTISSPTATTYLDTSAVNGTTYYYVVNAVNGSGQTSGNSNQVTLTPVADLAINAGGPAVGAFIADTDFSGGGGTGTNWTGAVDTSAVTGPAPQQVYQSEHYGAVTCTVPVLTPNASYKVRLHFTEDFVTGAGQRQFNVLINNTQVLTNFDIYATTGAEHKANIQEFITTANASGQIAIAFTLGSAQNPKVDGIEILANGGGGIPPAPTGLTATPGNTQVALSWNASSGATAYDVKRSTVNGSGYATVSSPTATSYTNTGLANGTAYYFVVDAKNASGTSGNSAQVTATPTAGGAPPPPTNLVATVNGTTISLTFTPSPGQAWYNIWRGTTSGGETLYGTGQVNQPFADNNMPNGTYYYKVVAVNSAGQASGFSNEANATVGSGGPPPAPTGLTATPGNAQVALSWTASSGATAYDVKRSTVNGSGYVTVSSPTVTNYTNTGLTNGTTYYFVVDAKNASGTSGNSAQASATPTAGGSAPPAPTGLAATAGTAQALLYWTGSTGATSYNISRSTVSGSGYTSIATGITVTTYTNTGLTNGITYYYVVSATNANGTSANSAQSSATPAAGAPANPTALTATRNGTTIQLTFTVPTGQSWYDIYRGTAAGCETFIGGGQVNQPFSDNGLASGTYYYKVVSFNSAGIASGFSNEASATVP